MLWGGWAAICISKNFKMDIDPESRDPPTGGEENWKGGVREVRDIPYEERVWAKAYRVRIEFRSILPEVGAKKSGEDLITGICWARIRFSHASRLNPAGQGKSGAWRNHSTLGCRGALSNCPPI